LAADKITAQNEKQIDADPAEAIDAPGRFETEERGVIDGDDDDGKGAEKIKARLAFTTRETRINCYYRRLLLNNEKLAVSSLKKTRCRQSDDRQRVTIMG
jgi:hypothetical protein